MAASWPDAADPRADRFEAGVELAGEAGMEALRAKSIALTELCVALHDAVLAPLGFRLGTPRDPERRGSTCRSATTRPGRSAAR